MVDFSSHYEEGTFSCFFTCLIMLELMQAILNFTWWGSVNFCISVNILKFCAGIKLFEIQFNPLVSSFYDLLGGTRAAFSLIIPHHFIYRALWAIPRLFIYVFIHVSIFMKWCKALCFRCNVSTIWRQDLLASHMLKVVRLSEVRVFQR